MSGKENAPLIESRADLIEVMAAGGKPKSEWRVGTEHEKHVYRKNPLRP
ncbi:MAG: Glutamate--cysteine ligase, partial [Devosia sp.]|nr:Glutamate--cysteine ligase [Devosia sp.]